MIKISRFKKFLPFLVIISMLFLMVCPSPVFAEGEDTNEEPAQEEVITEEEPAAEEEVASEAPAEEIPANEVVIEEQTVVEEVSEAVSAEGEALPKEENTEVEVTAEEDVSDIVEALYEADAVLIDEEGEPIPLASGQAKLILSQPLPDPVICPPGSTSPSDPGCVPGYTTITSAVTAADPNSVIFVEAGTYIEWDPANRVSVVIDKPLTLIGADKNTTIIQGPNSNTDYMMNYGTLILIKSSDVTIKGFTFSGANAAEDAKYGETYYGIEAKPTSGNPTLNNITIQDNIFTFISQKGVQFQSVEKSVISDNEFQRETRQVWYDPPGVTPGSNISVARGGSGPGLWSSSNVVVDNNTMQTNGVGIFEKNGNSNQFINNTIEGLHDSDFSDHGIHVQSSTNTTIKNNTIFGFTGGLAKYYNHGKLGAAIVVYSGSSALVVEENHLYDNSIGVIAQTYQNLNSPDLTLKDNIISGNTADGLVNVKYPASGSWKWWDECGNPLYTTTTFEDGDPTINAVYNYWGCDNGPGTTGCDTITGTATYDPWLIDPDCDLVFESSDGSGGYVDNCPATYNPDQKDSDGDGAGDACDPTPYPPTPPMGGAGAGPCPLIPVIGRELVELSCDYANTLELPGGESIIFYSILCGYFAQVITETEETLPAELPDGVDFVAGVTLNLFLDGEPVEGETQTVSFAIPEGMEGSDFAILAWDADTSSWVEVGGVTVSDGFVTVTVDYPGTFVLVAR